MPILNNFGPIIISNSSSTQSVVLDNCGVENIIGVGSAKIYVNNKMTVLGKVKFQNSNNVSFGMNGSVITASALAGSGANFVLSNTNGISFGTAGSVVTASYTAPTDYFSSNQSTLLQLTANNSLSLGTSYTSHTHSQYLNTSQSTLFLTNQSVQPISISASNGSTTLISLQLGTENGLTLYHSNGSILGSYTDGGGGGGDGVNRISAGTQIAGLTQTVVLSNSNNVSFGMNGNSVVTASASYSQPTDYISTAQSSLFQQTSLMSNYLGTDYTSHSHSQYLNTSQSSLFQATSDNSLSLGTEYTSHTHSQYVNTSQSSLFQQTSLMSNYLNTSQSSLFEQSSHTTIFLTSQSAQAFSASGGSSTFQTLNFANSNGFTFSNTNGSIRASYTVPTDYVSTNQSSLFALTANDSLSLGTGYTTHTHSQYVNTSQSSLFQQTSLMSNYLGTAATQSFRHTSADSQLLFTSQSSLFQATSDNSLSLGTAYTTHTHSQYVNTSQSSLFALTANDSLSLGTGYTTHTHSQYVNTSQSSLFEQSSHTTIFAVFSHSHGNPTLALTNLTGTTASNSGGFTLSLSAAPGGGGADGYNILAAGTQTATTAGTVVLSNSNGISFGMSNSSVITASYTVPTDYVSTAQSSLFFQTSNSSLFELSSHTTLFLTTQSGQAFSASGGSSIFQTLSFQDSNGISFSNNAGGIRVSHALQFTSNTSAITASALNTSQSSLFQHTSATSAITSNALNTSQSSLFQHTSATSAITSNALNTSASRVINIVAATNNTGGGTASLSNNVSFSNANGVTFYTSAGSAIVGSVNTSYAASNHSHGNPTLALTNLSGTTASASNGFTLSLSAAAPGGGGGGIVLANSQTTYTSGTVNLSGAGAITIASSTGQNFQISVPGTSSLSATGIISISTNGSTVSIGASQSNQNISLYALGNTTQNSSTVLNASALSFNGINGATIGFSNGSIQISAATGGTGGGGGGIALANSQTTYTSGTAHLSGAGAISVISTTGQSYILSAPGSSSISGTGQVSISVNGSTISIGVPEHEHRSFYNPYGDLVMVAGQVGQGTLNINPNDFPKISFDRVYMPINNSNATNSSGSHTLSFWLGIYTRSVSTLSLLTSASQTYALTHSGTVGSYSLYSGMRHVSIPLTGSLEEGLYYVGVISRTTSGGANGSYSQILVSNLNSNFLGHFGSAQNTTMQFRPGVGVYSATTSAMPASIQFSQLRGSDSLAQRPPVLIFANSTV